MLTAKKVHHSRLRKIMEDHGLKAREVAAFLGVKPQTVRAYMCGARALSKRQIDKVQAAISA